MYILTDLNSGLAFTTGVYLQYFIIGNVTGSTKTIVLHFWEYNWQYENNGTSLLGI
jgi:hypothetical protein